MKWRILTLVSIDNFYLQETTRQLLTTCRCDFMKFCVNGEENSLRRTRDVNTEVNTLRRECLAKKLALATKTGEFAF
jgi:hypothetical protein